MDHELHQAISTKDGNAWDRCLFGGLTSVCGWGHPLLRNEIASGQILWNGGSRSKCASDGDKSRELHGGSKMCSVFGRKRRSLMLDLLMVVIFGDKARQHPVPL
jgi:hypothetical protein